MRTGGVELPWLLRQWRVEVAQLSQSVVATRMSISEGALSMWENGRRRIDLAQLKALDVCYGAGGALLDLALGLGTPAGLPARQTWACNVQGPSHRCWAWLRPQVGKDRVAAVLRWGAFGFNCSEPCGERGLLITSPVSMPNPAVWVHLREPGWVDFGRGAVPQQLGILALDAQSGAQVAGGGHSPAGLVAPHIVDRFTHDREFAEQVVKFFGGRPDLVRQVFSTTEGWDRVVDLTTEMPSPTDDRLPFTGEQYRRLREGRGLSQAETALLATELMPDEPVTDDQIRVLERGGTPHTKFIHSRLDYIYRADGNTCIEEVRIRGTRSPFTIKFPSFWIGPVWITLSTDGDSPVGHARLLWGPSSKRMFLRTGTTVACRRPTPESVPLKVFCGPGRWKVTAGVGIHPSARDVNWGWTRIDDQILRQNVGSEVNELFLTWLGRTKGEFAAFLREYEQGVSKSD